MRVFRDTWLIFERSMTLTLRNPVWLIMGLMQPILYLLLFGPLLKNIASMPGFPPRRRVQRLRAGHPRDDRPVQLGLRRFRPL